MNGIGSFRTGMYVPSPLDVTLADVELVTEGLEALTVTPKWRSAVADTNRKISEFHERLALRRTQRKNEVNAMFMDGAHVDSICGHISDQNSQFVQRIVTHSQFLGNLRKKAVEALLKDQKAKRGILYIESEWVPINLKDSCSPKQLEATLLFSFSDGCGGVEHCNLTPAYGLEHVFAEHGTSFLEVDPSIQAIEAFQGFSAYNLLRMQTVACNDKALTRVAFSITRDELNAFITADDKRAQLSTDRYDDVWPYLCNSVGTGVDGQDINGSYVWAGNRLFITCQGPRAQTVEAFWQAASYHGTDTIIALGPSREGQREKFNDKYFTFGETLTLSDGTCIIKIADDTALDWEFMLDNGVDKINHCIICRTFECTSPQWGKHIVRHYHCPTWEDMTGGDPRILTELIRCIDKSGDTPVMVHCSAGVGRTGTLVTGYELQHAQKPVALLVALIRLRHQRHGLVQTAEQMEMLLRFISFL